MNGAEIPQSIGKTRGQDSNDNFERKKKHRGRGLLKRQNVSTVDIMESEITVQSEKSIILAQQKLL